MDKIELIKLFLKQKGLTWNGKIIEGREEFIAKDKDFNKDRIRILPVTIPEKGINDEFEIVIRVDEISFITYGISYDMDTPTCFAVTDEYRDILDNNNLTKEWQEFCLNNKGVVYKIAVDKYVKEQKRIASDNYHNATLKHINAIKKEAEVKNGIFKLLDVLQEDINTQYENLN